MFKYFGTDGYRGIANSEIKVEQALKIGQYIGSNAVINKNPKIVIGKDTRVSSYMLEYAIASGITSVGCDAYIMHVTTTPSISMTVINEGFSYGVMISASHNSWEFNGIKLFDNKGNKITDEETLECENFIDEGVNQYTGTPGKIIDYVEGRNKYISQLIGKCKHSFRDIHIALDCANGASWMIAKAVFSSLGAEVYSIGDDPDGFNINNGCGSTHVNSLINFIKRRPELRIDIGFAFDGDADRCLTVDRFGNIIDGDASLFIIGRYLSSKGLLDYNTIVGTILTNTGLDHSLNKYGVQVVRTKVGDKYVHEEMERHGYILGGETSGHTIYSKYSNTGDGILTALLITEVMCSLKCKSDELVKDLVLYEQSSINVKVDKEFKNYIIEQGYLDKLNSEFRKDIDITNIVVRPSGTEPCIRVMVESKSPGVSSEICNKIALLIKEFGRN